MQPRRLPLPEFVALMALIFSLLAFSIDAMLPAFPEIAAELSPDNANNAQLILTFFVLGMGFGTLFTGPLSDTFGRLPVISAGIGIYILGAGLAYFAPTLETLLAARALQGLGAAAPRVVAMALVRDLYEGRRMAQITSIIMTVFMLVPAAAPSIGQIVIDLFGWRSIFPAFIVFGLVGLLWLNLRQTETLAKDQRRPFTLPQLIDGLRAVVSDRLVVIYIVVMTLGFTQMFALISSTQQLYDQTYGRGATFPLWFMGTAILAGAGTIVNAQLVMRIGMRKLASVAYLAQALFSTLLLALWYFNIIPQTVEFWVFLVWTVSVFFMAGLTFGNLNALALQPLGHIAGMAASLIAAVSTILSVILAAPISLAYNGTPLPVLCGTVVCSALAWLLLRQTAGAAPNH